MKIVALENLANLFAQQKYVVMRSCIAGDKSQLLYRYACRRAETNSLAHDKRVPEAWSAYGDVFTEGLLLDLLPVAEAITRLKLFPTYSYFRVYKRGNILPKHSDRPACEISVSLCLGYEAERTWPLLFETPDGVSSVELEPGDALFYRGVELTHWREPMVGENAAQVFLHYVDQSGPYAEWKFDKRKDSPSARPKSLRRCDR